jgi:hypothetical protein
MDPDAAAGSAIGIEESDMDGVGGPVGQQAPDDGGGSVADDRVAAVCGERGVGAVRSDSSAPTT